MTHGLTHNLILGLSHNLILGLTHGLTLGPIPGQELSSCGGRPRRPSARTGDNSDPTLRTPPGTLPLSARPSRQRPPGEEGPRPEPPAPGRAVAAGRNVRRRCRPYSPILSTRSLFLLFSKYLLSVFFLYLPFCLSSDSFFRFFLQILPSDASFRFFFLSLFLFYLSSPVPLFSSLDPKKSV